MGTPALVIPAQRQTVQVVNISMGAIIPAVVSGAIRRIMRRAGVGVLGGATVIDTPVLYVQLTSYLVNTGQTVRVRATNGTVAGNASPVLVSKSLDDAQNDIGELLQPWADAAFPVLDTGHIYVSGAAGDGLQVTIKDGQNF